MNTIQPTQEQQRKLLKQLRTELKIILKFQPDSEHKQNLLKELDIIINSITGD